MGLISAYEASKFGTRIENGGDMHEAHHKFLEWAFQYDKGYMGGRSKKKHDDWVETLSCPIVRIEGIVQLDEAVQMAKKFLASFKFYSLT